MDDVFRALADPTRRSLLDKLYAEDGQTLTALEERLPMTRFGVMKHLRVLEAAGLVTTRRRGREKLHFLNAVPIRLIHDRWVSKYAEPWAATLTGLKRHSRRRTRWKRCSRSTSRRHRSASGRRSPTRSCAAATRSECRCAPTGRRARATRVASGGPGLLMDGENLEVDPPRRLIQSFNARWSEDVEREGTSRVTWEIEPIEDSCRLTLTHDQMREDANAEIYGGWPQILSGLKTLLETGESLTTPGSLMYAGAS